MSWNIDLAHSHIQFSARHMMLSTVRGEFKTFSGTVDFDEDHPEKSTVFIQIDASSIGTGQNDRDNHLRSADFLHVSNHPYIVFRSKRVEQIDDERGQIVGELTIRGVTREVVLDVEYYGQVKSPWGYLSAGFSASTTINRKDWGLTWNQALETGGVLVGDRIRINLDVELIKETEEEAEVASR